MLARLEARLAWEEMLRRLPEYEIAADPQHFRSTTSYGWKALHLAVEPKGVR